MCQKGLCAERAVLDESVMARGTERRRATSLAGNYVGYWARACDGDYSTGREPAGLALGPVSRSSRSAVQYGVRVGASQWAGFLAPSCDGSLSPRRANGARLPPEAVSLLAIRDEQLGGMLGWARK
jgi:hypothetical protein